MLYTKEQLTQMQKDDVWPLSDNEDLQTRFADRWTKAESLLMPANRDFFLRFNDKFDDDPVRIEDWKDENIPDKSYADKFGGACFSYDEDYMIGPEDWDDSDDKEKVGDYVLRKKLYLYNWSRDRYNSQSERDENLEYFMDMHDAYVPVLEHYAKECFSDQDENVKFHLYKLMIIMYATPTADENNLVEHRKHNTDRFGPDHCDETLGGLHLGENYAEFEAQEPTSKKWTPIGGLTDNKTLWMFGEFGEQSGWTPTYHRMIHNPDPTISGNRYSIIFDLQARYKDDD